MKKEASYHGNKNLKTIGYQHDFTQEQIQEIVKCKENPLYFIENYCQIISLDGGLVPFKLYECQKKKVNHILFNRFAIIMEPRQNGKTIVAAACILWYTLFQDSKTVAVIANKGSAAREVLNRYQIMYENLPIWMQQGVKTWNKGDIELENGSKVFTSATTISAVKGRSINWLYVDETAAIPNNIADAFFASVYPTISAGQTTKVLLTSTPLGYNHFWKYWNEASPEGPRPEKTAINDTYFCNGVAGRNGFVRMFIPYWDIPGRDEIWAEAQRKLLGEVKYNQEVSCQFLGSSNTLINGRTLALLSSLMPMHTSMELDVYESPVKGRIYVLVADVAQGSGGDYSAFVVVDASEIPYKLVAKYRNNDISPLLYPTAIHKVAKEYNNAFILVEVNDIGKQVVDILFTELEYENIISTVNHNGNTSVSPGFATTTVLGVKTNKVVKRQGCFAIKSLMEEQKIQIFDADTISEFSTFIEKNGLYKADEGKHDDLVMSLVLFGWLTTNQYFRELTDINVREKIYKNQMEQIEADLTPFGEIVDGREDEPMLEGGDLWKLAR